MARFHITGPLGLSEFDQPLDLRLAHAILVSPGGAAFAMSTPNRRRTAGRRQQAVTFVRWRRCDRRPAGCAPVAMTQAARLGEVQLISTHAPIPATLNTLYA